MNESQVVAALSALAQDTRLNIVRYLVRQGATGANAGAISTAVDVSPSRLSFHLSALEKGALVKKSCASRHIIYAVNFASLATLVEFLTEECCVDQSEQAECC